MAPGSGSARRARPGASDGGGKAAASDRSGKPETIEQRLIAKAEAADRHDYSGQRSLGQMSREEVHALLFGSHKGQATGQPPGSCADLEQDIPGMLR